MFTPSLQCAAAIPMQQPPGSGDGTDLPQAPSLQDKILQTLLPFSHLWAGSLCCSFPDSTGKYSSGKYCTGRDGSKVIKDRSGKAARGKGHEIFCSLGLMCSHTSQMHKEKTPRALNCCCRGQTHSQRVLNGLCMTNRASAILLSSLPQALKDIINITWMMPLHQRCVCQLAQEQRRKCWCVWGEY